MKRNFSAAISAFALGWLCAATVAHLKTNQKTTAAAGTASISRMATADDLLGIAVQMMLQDGADESDMWEAMRDAMKGAKK